MQPVYVHFTLLAVSLSLLLAQLTVRDKHSAHILFAIFCGSVSMVALKQLTGDTIGPYQYLIGMAACATCNCIWLFSRALFREKNPIGLLHLAVALTIAALIMIQQGYLFATHQWAISPAWLPIFSHLLREATILLSSCILVLSFWEALRGFKHVRKAEQQQRVLFMVTFGCAVLVSKSVKGIFASSPEVLASIISGITLCVLVSLQPLLSWRFNKTNATREKTVSEQSNSQSRSNETSHNMHLENDTELGKQVQSLLIEQNYYLQTNLKVADIARALNVPEYKISRALKNHLHAKNFNQLINTLRVERAKQILIDPEKHHWSVLVVGLECGFASVGPFTRAFKTYTGTTPNQYRQRSLFHQRCT
ncbi:helix-turn-helix transcriptional regulator [Pseudoalteromonas luteoviolacea]|uniref:HTH araC/xylS-type domain-containing protein n=1 Tax=Pseudoalteromonas luteoviolacea NCIMB 1942 TaxID=1365253 RepID=A0A167C4V7_9GAMM|nr:helix-turn-helix transcriptional regulator [Pseudoalteromonas luteoviolacea]KZN47240.1 hypothetical protein N482_10010 [Pseudoalteromonas luteoviolacea NCIMB 1942]